MTRAERSIYRKQCVVEQAGAIAIPIIHTLAYGGRHVEIRIPVGPFNILVLSLKEKRGARTLLSRGAWFEFGARCCGAASYNLAAYFHRMPMACAREVEAHP